MLALCLDSVSFRGFCEFKILRTLTLVAPETWILYSKQTIRNAKSELSRNSASLQATFDKISQNVFSSPDIQQASSSPRML